MKLGQSGASLMDQRRSNYLEGKACIALLDGALQFAASCCGQGGQGPAQMHHMQRSSLLSLRSVTPLVWRTGD